MCGRHSPGVKNGLQQIGGVLQSCASVSSLELRNCLSESMDGRGMRGALPLFRLIQEQPCQRNRNHEDSELTLKSVPRIVQNPLRGEAISIVLLLYAHAVGDKLLVAVVDMSDFVEKYPTQRA